MLCRTALAEQAILESLDTQALEEFAAGRGFDWMSWVQQMLCGNRPPTEVFALLRQQGAAQFLRDAKALFGRMTALILIASMMKVLVDDRSSVQKTALFICRAGGIAALSEAYLKTAQAARMLLRETAQASDLMAPILTAAVVLGGSEAAAGFLTPMMAAAVNLILNGLNTWGFAMSTAAACFAIAGNLSEKFSLKRLHQFLRQGLYWATGLMMTAFMGVLSIQGRLAQGRDSAAARTAKYAIESLVPVIGGNVSDSLETMLGAASLVKNAVGASGLMLLAGLCIRPLIQIAGSMFLLKLMSALSEPVGETAMADLTEQFSQVMEMVLVIALTGVLLCALLTGSCMAVTRGTVR